MGSFWNPFGVGVGAVLTWVSLNSDLSNSTKFAILGLGVVFILAAIFNLVREHGWLSGLPPRSNSGMREDVTMNKRNTIDVSGDNNQVQVGHLGDVNINQAPEPDLKIVSNTDMTNPDGTHSRVIRLQVVAPYPAGRLQIEAEAHGVLDGDIQPVDSGIIQFGSSRDRPNIYYVSVDKPFGRYDLVVKTPSKTPIKLTYAFN